VPADRGGIAASIVGRYAYKEIGRRLETHVSAVLRKLQLSSRYELARWATDRRLTSTTGWGLGLGHSAPRIRLARVMADNGDMPATQGRGHRRRHGQIVAGVSGQLAARLGVHVNLVRLSFVVLTFAGGTGLVAYAMAMLVFREPDPDELAARADTDAWQALALAAVVIGALLAARFTGLWFDDSLAWPVAAIAIGFGLIWLQAPRIRPGYIVAGALLLGAGVGALVVNYWGWIALRNGLLGVTVLLGIVAIAAAPWRTRRVATLAEALTDVAAEVQQEYGVSVDVSRKDDFALAGLEPLVLAAREGMRNAARHSGAATVTVVVQRNGSGPSVLIRDRGRGFDPKRTSARGGLALSVIRPIAAAGGTAKILSRPGMGCELELVLPRERDAAS